MSQYFKITLILKHFNNIFWQCITLLCLASSKETNSTIQTDEYRSVIHKVSITPTPTRTSLTPYHFKRSYPEEFNFISHTNCRRVPKSMLIRVIEQRILAGNKTDEF